MPTPRDGIATLPASVRGSGMPVPTEQTIALTRLTLRAQCWGEPDAPPLLALHGWLDNAGSFALLAPLLAGSHRVLALDLPGRGHSDHAAGGGDYHYIDQVRAVLEAAEVLQLARYTLLGHSMGAGIASLVAAAAPGRIERLLLIEGMGPLGDDGSATLTRFRTALAARAQGRRPQRVFDSVEQAVSARCLASGMPTAQARPIVERGLIETDGGWRWRSDPRLTRPSAARLAESQVHALLRGIEAPTALLLARPATPYLPSAPMLARAACVAQMTVQHMDGGHHLQLEHPEAVAAWARAAPRESPAIASTPFEDHQQPQEYHP
jgi:pimeloyl-ACP methyl ester carboxylesterase